MKSVESAMPGSSYHFRYKRKAGGVKTLMIRDGTTMRQRRGLMDFENPARNRNYLI